MRRQVHCRRAAWIVSVNLTSDLEISRAFFRQSENMRASSRSWTRTTVRRFVMRHFTVSDSELPESEIRTLVSFFNRMAENPPRGGTAAILEAIAS